MNMPMRYFEELYAQSADPWEYRQRWYESRKRDLTLAALPHPRYSSAFEPGCSIGELSANLATRCDALLISDGNDTAIAHARSRLASEPHVRIEKRLLPDAWPDEQFDLIVFSELGYYFSPDALTVLASRMQQSLLPGGVLIACHWRHPIEGCALNGDEVHQHLSRALGMSQLSQHEEQDFLISVWSSDASSVASREGFL
ncbi:SAM-dependent methyltransferase [Pseudomonas matsuisoli]|uniref:Methyltransferase n=1 Tax=Pseudomonas matsuisoli TaxID=1515666 RepID=A0A917PU53_9PSED|nr:class I SAM-dependent methyltransferase [Pseudomonas matsuisoli]GGJ91747.1 methyltransferase [Pseudomonas matsuisoli]